MLDMDSNRLPLDDDVLDRILMLSPSFSALQSALLSSRSFYPVYLAHPRSIVRAVADNVAGPGLTSEALKVASYQTSDDGIAENDDCYAPSHTTDTSDYDTSASASQVPEAESDVMTPIAPDTARKLTANAEVVRKLEDLFSFRCVSFSSPT